VSEIALGALQAATWRLRAAEAYRKDGKTEDAQRCKAEAIEMTRIALEHLAPTGIVSYGSRPHEETP
jgi:hypothetical protein